MNRPSPLTPNQPPGAAGAAGPVVLPDGSPGELAAMLPPGNVVVGGGPGSGKTALLEAPMHRLLARPEAARFLTSSRQAAIASTERLLAALTGASGGELGCVTWYAFARALVTSHADLLDYRGEPRPLSGPEQWPLVRSLLAVDAPTVDWGPLAPLVDTRAFTDELAEFVLACERRLVRPEDLLERPAPCPGPAPPPSPPPPPRSGRSWSTRPRSSTRPRPGCSPCWSTGEPGPS